MGKAVDDHLRRIDLAVATGAGIGALAGAELGAGKGVLPAEVIPIIDGKRERDHIVAIHIAFEEGIGRRA